MLNFFPASRDKPPETAVGTGKAWWFFQKWPLTSWWGRTTPASEA